MGMTGIKASWKTMAFGAALFAAISVSTASRALVNEPPVTGSSAGASASSEFSRRLDSISRSAQEILELIENHDSPELYCELPGLDAAVESLSDDVLWLDLASKEYPDGHPMRTRINQVRKTAARVYGMTVLHCAWGHDGNGVVINTRKVVSAALKAASVSDEVYVVDAREPASTAPSLLSNPLSGTQAGRGL